jgi:ABC-type Fe3+/spermidine/putrescine transport system ATPase subunit
VALARSLALEPRILLLDEPLSALDPSLRAQVRGELKALQRQVGITFLMVTHDCEEALSLSDQIALLREGHLVQLGHPEALYASPVSRFAAEFMGPVSWVDGIGLRPQRARLAAQPGPEPLKSLEGTIREAVYLGAAVRVEVRGASGERLWADLPPGPRPQVGERAFVVWHPEDELRPKDERP